MSIDNEVVLKDLDAQAYRMIKQAEADFVRDPLDSDWNGNYLVANAARGIIDVFKAMSMMAPRKERVIEIAKAFNNHCGLEQEHYEQAISKMMVGGKKKFLRSRREQGGQFLELNFK